MSLDTIPEIAAIQQSIFRRMTTAQRLRLALEMRDSLRNIALAGLRSREPGFSTGELSRELLPIMYGFLRGLTLEEPPSQLAPAPKHTCGSDFPTAVCYLKMADRPKLLRARATAAP